MLVCGVNPQTFSMTCYNPKIAYFTKYKTIDDLTGEIKDTLHLTFKPNKDPLDENAIIIPCGKCAGCKCDYASQWSVRCLLEAQKWPKNIFLTLTYDNQHRNLKGLEKRDFQLFMKKLRHEQKEPIKYFCAGEYGLKTRREHMHCILFNYEPKDLKFFKYNKLKQPLFTSKTLQKIWRKGFITIGQVTAESCAYVARYVQKKAYEIPVPKGKNPEFILTSRRPGISANTFLGPNWETIKRNAGVFIPTANGVKLKPIPTYLRNKWREYNREEYLKNFDEIRTRNKEETRAQLSQTTKNYWEQNALKIAATKKGLTKLKRDL